MDEREFLKRFNRALTFEELDPDTDEGKRYYVEFSQANVAEVAALGATIELASEATAQVLTGPNGSGKTTELLRLARDLRGQGHSVAYVDVLPLLSQTSPVGIVDFLVAIALGVTDKIGTDDRREGAWQRLRDLVDRVSVQGAGVTLGGVGVTVDLKAELKGNRAFVERLRSHLEPNLASFVLEIQRFIGEFYGNADGLAVLIVDSTEKLGGSDEVLGSVKDLFLYHGDKLRIPGVHVIYTVPPYLPTLVPGFLISFDRTVRQVLTPKLTTHAGSRDDEHVRETRRLLVDVVQQREPSWEQLLAPDQLDRLITASGGHRRDLFRLVKETISKSLRAASPPRTPSSTGPSIPWRGRSGR